MLAAEGAASTDARKWFSGRNINEPRAHLAADLHNLSPTQQSDPSNLSRHWRWGQRAADIVDEHQIAEPPGTFKRNTSSAQGAFLETRGVIDKAILNDLNPTKLRCRAEEPFPLYRGGLAGQLTKQSKSDQTSASNGK
jgi:hypothetical protein